MTIKDGRQWATSLAEIRRDHVERYRWAAPRVSGTVADLGCGIGYGSLIMADAGRMVKAYDVSGEAIAFAEAHWGHPRVHFFECDLAQLQRPLLADLGVCFELIEHLEAPVRLLAMIDAPKLVCSVPNQDVMPFDPARHSYHHRHYTRAEFDALLKASGWRIDGWYGQTGKASPVEPKVNGMTLIAECSR